MSSDWVKTLASVAPTIASAFGTPLAGVAVKLATDALGLTDSSEESLKDAILSGDPNVLLKLKEAENTFKIEMKRLDIKRFEHEVDDRKSARSMSADKRPQVILSTLFVIGYFGLVAIMCTGNLHVDEKAMPVFLTLMGVLTAGMTMVMQFWFGSSSGSKDKTDKMESAIKRMRE